MTSAVAKLWLVKPHNALRNRYGITYLTLVHCYQIDHLFWSDVATLR